MIGSAPGATPPTTTLHPPTREALTVVPEHLCRLFDALPIRVEGDELTVAIGGDPDNESATAALRDAADRAGLRGALHLVAADPEEVARGIADAHGGGHGNGNAPAAPIAASAAGVHLPGDVLGLGFLADPPLADDAFDVHAPNPLATLALPQDVCRLFGILPVALRDGVLTLATARPSDTLALKVARTMAQRRGLEVQLRLLVLSPDALARAMSSAFTPVPAAPQAPAPAPARDGRMVSPWAPAPAPAPAAPPVEAPPDTSPRPLGERLVAAGVLSESDLAHALALQRRSGDQIGTILTHAGYLDEDTVSAVLADQLDLELVDLEHFEPDLDLLSRFEPALLIRHRVVPLDVADGRLRIAMVNPGDDAANAELTAVAGLPLSPVLARDTQVDAVLQSLTAIDNVDAAVLALVRNRPEESAYKVLSSGQKVTFVALIVLTVIALAIAPIKTIIVFNIVSILFYASFSLYRFWLIYHALSNDYEVPVTDADVEALDEHDLPIYTVLVPLYMEAAILPKLLNSIASLDYPATKLDVKVLVEEDDHETIAVYHSLRPPPHFKLVVVPDALPKTKPKACNYGLLHARGDLTVIYDAEDQPEPDQLKKVVAAFLKAPEDVACVQCKLNYFNRGQNILTRWFTTEYSMWFDVYLPGLDASDAPIPLGGTSNHFITANLLELGAWDPYNVAEDADLGIRLCKAGLKTAVVDSTTFEEANSDLHNWVRQRSRWVKGYIQTWLVHMRHPIRLCRQLGLRRFLSFQMTVGGTFIGFLLNPVYWALTTLYVPTQAGLIRQLFPSFIFYAAAAALVLGNFVFTYVNVAGSMGRGYYDLVKFALLSPVYWAMMSLGAWKGFIQLFTNPFYWEKTIHGLDQ